MHQFVNLLQGRKTRKNKAKETASKTPSSRVERYDVLNSIAHAPSGISFGKILRGDATEARGELQRLFSGKKNLLLSMP